MKITRNAVGLCAAFGLGIVLLASCGSKTAGAGQAKSAAPAPAAAVQNITWSMWLPEPVETLKLFNSQNKDVQIQYEMLSSDQYVNIINTRIMSGQAPDIFTGRGIDNYKAMVANGVFYDLTGQSYLANYDPEVIRQNTFNGKTYGVPISSVFLALICNKQLFDKYNVKIPEYWDDYLAACATFKKNGVTPLIQGTKDLFQTQLIPGEPVQAMCTIDPDWSVKLSAGQVKLTDPQAVSFFKRYQDFLAPAKGYIDPGSNGMTMVQAWQQFCNGKAAMMGGGSYYVNQDYPSAKPNGFDLVLAPWPLGEKKGDQIKIAYTAHANVMSVNAKSKNLQATLTFIGWMSQPDNAAFYGKQTQDFIAMKGAKNDFSPDAKLWNDYLIKYPNKVDKLNSPAVITPDYEKGVQELIAGTSTAQQVVDRVQGLLDAALKK